MSGTLPLRSYRPGTWFGLVGERALVALPPTEKARVAALWELVDEGAGFDVTLDALISAGLRDLPGFVLVSTDEGQTDVVHPRRRRRDVHGRRRGGRASRGPAPRPGSSGRCRRSSGCRSSSRRSVPTTSSAPSYVVDGGLFRVSRIEETPARRPSRPVRTLHVVESPETGGVIPFAAVAAVAEEQADEPDLDGRSRPDGARGRRRGSRRSGSPTTRRTPEPPVRSPEPPAWTPAPPDDHDGLTLTGPPLPATATARHPRAGAGAGRDHGGRAAGHQQRPDRRRRPGDRDRARAGVQAAPGRGPAAAGHRAQRRTSRSPRPTSRCGPAPAPTTAPRSSPTWAPPTAPSSCSPASGPQDLAPGRARAAAARRAHRHRRRHHDPGHPPLTSDAMTAAAPSQSPLPPGPTSRSSTWSRPGSTGASTPSCSTGCCSGACTPRRRPAPTRGSSVTSSGCPGWRSIAGAVLLLTLVYSAVARRLGDLGRQGAARAPGARRRGRRADRLPARPAAPGHPRAGDAADARLRRRRAGLDGGGRPRRPPPRLARPAGRLGGGRRPSATGARGRGRRGARARSST